MHCTAEPTHEIPSTSYDDESGEESAFELSEDEVEDGGSSNNVNTVYKDTSSSEAEEYSPDLSEQEEAEPEAEVITRPNGGSPVSFKQEAALFLTRIERQPKQLEHLSPDGGTVFVLTQSSGELYRSFDNGQTWMDSSQWIDEPCSQYQSHL